MSNDNNEMRSYIYEVVMKKAMEMGLEDMEVTDKTSFVGSGLYDSVDYIGLLADVESRSGIQLDFMNIDAENLGTIGGLIEVVLAAIGKRGV